MPSYVCADCSSDARRAICPHKADMIPRICLHATRRRAKQRHSLHVSKGKASAGASSAREDEPFFIPHTHTSSPARLYLIRAYTHTCIYKYCKSFFGCQSSCVLMHFKFHFLRMPFVQAHLDNNRRRITAKLVAHDMGLPSGLLLQAQHVSARTPPNCAGKNNRSSYFVWFAG